MAFKDRFEKHKNILLSDETICRENREIFKKFFEWEMLKLKVRSDLDKLDEACYNTLYGFILKIKNVSEWFNNKSWYDITEADIKRVYEDLENGKILNKSGKPFKDRKSYYNKVFKSKLFQIAGKADIARQVIQFYRNGNDEVKFIGYDDFLSIVSYAIKPEHRLILWLGFDIGENVNSLLMLKKRDCVRALNKYSNEPEYNINFRKTILKRSRTPRTEPTNFQETVKLLDLILKDKKEEDNIFHFGYQMAKKLFNRCLKYSEIKCKPGGGKPTLRVLRSSMGCYLLNEGWTTDEVKARLGHKPSSTIIDKYVSYLALGRHKPKQKIIENNYEKLSNSLNEAKKREKVFGRKIERLQERVEKYEKKGELIEKFLDPKAMQRLFKLVHKLQKQINAKRGLPNHGKSIR